MNITSNGVGSNFTFSRWSGLIGASTISLSAISNPTSNTAPVNVLLPGNCTASVQPGSIKFSLNIDSPQGSSMFFGSAPGSNMGSFNGGTPNTGDEMPAKTLSWGFTISVAQVFGNYSESSRENVSKAIRYTYSRSKSQLILLVNTVAIADGTEQPVSDITVTPMFQSISLSTGNSTGDNNATSSANDTIIAFALNVTLSLPYFNTSLFYDPDLSVLTDSSSSGSSSGGGTSGDTGSSSSNNNIAAIVAPVVIAGVLLLACVVVIIVVVGGFMMHRLYASIGTRKRAGSVNFGGVEAEKPIEVWEM
eukprot:TRINITY_DN13947_c0_g1_i1.p1 TRINITY_DN13947_c0_g1~~TRINITY_DN13947_c0_g1_i1.p1  ORF type:complete len:306 (+),score=47.31 TRINITY_DN13947_c0_g1_i1:202-1119(+)